MSSLAFIVVVTAFTALIIDTSAFCSFQDCKDKFESVTEANITCRLAIEAFDCVEESANENDCSAIKDEIKEGITIFRKSLEQFGCSDAASLMASLGLCLALSGVTYFLMNFK